MLVRVEFHNVFVDIETACRQSKPRENGGDNGPYLVFLSRTIANGLDSEVEIEGL